MGGDGGGTEPPAVVECEDSRMMETSTATDKAVVADFPENFGILAGVEWNR
jgi:hypothetical protein